MSNTTNSTYAVGSTSVVKTYLGTTEIGGGTPPEEGFTEAFAMVVTAPVAPTFAVTGGDVVVSDNGDGTYNVVSDDTITKVMFGNTNDSEEITEVALHKTGTLTDMKEMFYPSSSNSMDALHTVTFESTVDTSSVITFERLFYQSSVTMIDLEHVSAASAISTKGMFGFCRYLTTITMDTFSTPVLESAHEMFYYCISLVSLDVTAMDFSKVTSLSNMFYYGASLTSINMDGVDFSVVTTSKYMFWDCNVLTTIDMSGTTMPNVLDMTQMFDGCTDATSILLPDFTGAQPTILHSMFEQCTSLDTVDFTTLDTSKCTDMSNMFYNSGLTAIDMTQLDLSSVQDVGYMFYSCDYITSIDLSSTAFSAVTDAYGFIYNCYGLTSLNVTGLDVSSVIDAGRMFSGLITLTSFIYSTLTFSSATSASGFFSYARDMTIIDFSGISFPVATSASYMFSECEEALDITPPDLSSGTITSMADMFGNCDKVTTIDLTPINSSNVTSFNSLFSYCKKLVTIDLTPLNSSKVTTFYRMFEYCGDLVNVNVTTLDTSLVENMNGVFRGCSDLVGVDLNGWDMTNVTNTYGMFYATPKLRYVTYLDTTTSTSKSNMFSAGILHPNPDELADLTDEDGAVFTYDPSEELIPLMTGTTAPSGVVTHSSEYGTSTTGYYALRGSDDFKWASASSSTDEWLEYMYDDDGVIATILQLTVPYNNIAEFPRSFQLLGSLDGVDYVILHEESDVPPPTRAFQEYFFEFSNEVKYKYYRILLTSSDASYKTLGDIQLRSYTKPAFANYEAAIPPLTDANDSPVGTASSSSDWSSTYLAPDAFYDDRTHRWVSADNATDEWLQFEFTNAQKIHSYMMAAPHDYKTEVIKTWTFEGSNNGVDYTVLDTVIDEPVKIDGEVCYYNIETPGWYTHYRIHATANEVNNGTTGFAVGRLQMFTSGGLVNFIPLMTSNTAPEGVASASSVDSSYYPWEAFNTNTDNYASNEGTDNWLQYEGATTAIPGLYSIRTSGNSANAPVDWTLQGSSNGVDWDILDTRLGETGWTTQDERFYIISNVQKSYSFYRFHSTLNNEGTRLALSNMQVYVHTVRSIGDLIPIMTSGTEPAGVVTTFEYWNGNFEGWRAFDGGTSAKYVTGGSASQQWVQYDFGVDISASIIGYDVGAPNTDVQETVVSWDLLGSKDGTNWNVLTSVVTAPDFIANEVRSYSLPKTNTYRYYRFNLNDTQDGGGAPMGLGSLQIIGSFA